MLCCISPAPQASPWAPVPAGVMLAAQRGSTTATTTAAATSTTTTTTSTALSPTPPPAPRSFGDLPTGALARVLAHLEFRDRCAAAAVCRTFAALVESAAAHAPTAADADRACDATDAAEDATAAAAAGGASSRMLPAPSAALWLAGRGAPCVAEAGGDDAQQLALRRCAALRHAPSAAVCLTRTAPATLAALGAAAVTRLELLDPRLDCGGGAHAHALAAAAARRAAPVSLRHLPRLRVAHLALAGPVVDLRSLPPSLRGLHLSLASGYSVANLRDACAALAAATAAGALPRLRHLTLAAELDALLSGSGAAAALAPLEACTQLTSLALAPFQLLPPSAPVHEGYAAVPAVLQAMPGLRSLDLSLCSGHAAALGPAARARDVSLALALARHEQAPFCRLPPSLGAALADGLTCLRLLSAEFEYSSDSDLYVFDVGALAGCRRLRSLLLELSGAKQQLHDLRGLAALDGQLDELVVLLKCPDVHDARPELSSCGGSVAGGGGGGQQQQQYHHHHHDAPHAPLLGGGGSGAGSWEGGSGGRRGSVGGGGGVKSLLAGALRRARHSAIASSIGGGGAQQVALAPATLHQHQQQQQQQQQWPLAEEEWLLGLVDQALDQIRPEFSLSVPRVRGRLLIATTSRLLLRQPLNVAAARRPLLLAAHLQPDNDAVGDAWGGQSFLETLSDRALHAWAARSWSPRGVRLLPAARYPRLGSYAGSRARVTDRLLAAARRGVAGADVVAEVMAVAEARCMSYFT